MTLLKEAKANTHLTHLEELVLTQGPKGYDMARAFLLELLETLKGNSKSHVQTSVKWDGAPAIFAGVNPENGKFFVGTKSIFNKVPKINYTPQDIIDNHGHAPGLVDKLTKALKYLPSLGIKNILQGDFMFDDEMLDVTEINGEPHYRFKPNTIVYAVPVDSDLGREIGQSKFGIVFHTTYDSLDSGASFGADVSGLDRPPGIWFDDAFFTDDTGTVTLTAGEEERVINLVDKADQVNEGINYNDLPSDLLNIYINSEIKGGEFLESPEKSFQGFLSWYSAKLETRIDKLKSEKGRMRAFNKGEEALQTFENKKEDMLNLFRVSRLLFEAKNIFIAKYNNAVYNTKHFIDDGSGDLVATNPEGYVAVDHEGNGVKFVDRLEFSRANFMVDKGDKFAQNESLTVYWGPDGFSTTKTLQEWASDMPRPGKSNEALYKKLQAGIPITSLIGEATMVKRSLAEAVFWRLNEQKGQSIALYPGKFKPPHAGHFDVAKEILNKPNVNKLIIFISPRPHEGISPDQAQAIWEMYKPYLPGDVEIRIGDISPVRSVYDYLDNEAQEGDILNLILGEKDLADGRYAAADERGASRGIGVNQIPVPPQAGGISATQMRDALRTNEADVFIAGMPTALNDQEIHDILTLLGEEPLEELEEVSGVGGVGPGIVGASSPVAPIRRRRPPRKRKNKKQDEGLVNEVMDYLLGISVG